MNNFITKMYVLTDCRLREFFHDQRGVTAVEYAIVLAGVAATVGVIFGKDGTVSTMLTDIFAKIQAGVDAAIGS